MSEPTTRPQTDAAQLLQDKLSRVIGWDAATSDIMEADLAAIEAQAAEKALADAAERARALPASEFGIIEVAAVLAILEPLR